MAEPKFKITRRIGVLSTDDNGWSKEFNMVSWNGARPKYDIRAWSPDHAKMGKGITLSAKEIVMLGKLIEGDEQETEHRDAPDQKLIQAEEVYRVEHPAIVEPLPVTSFLRQIARMLVNSEQRNCLLACTQTSILSKLDKNAYEHIAGRFAEVIGKSFDGSDYLAAFKTGEMVYRAVMAENGFSSEEIDGSVYEMHLRYMLGICDIAQDIAQCEKYQGIIPAVGKDDMETMDLALIFAKLPPQPEIAEMLKTVDVNYDYDHYHMVTWFSYQITLGSGGYSRAVPNHSAKTTYNKLLNPWSLLWIGAALGESESVIKAAHQEMQAKKANASKCGVVRKYVPFARILELAAKYRG